MWITRKEFDSIIRELKYDYREEIRDLRAECEARYYRQQRTIDKLVEFLNLELVPEQRIESKFRVKAQESQC